MLVEAGSVTVAGSVAYKPARQVLPGDPIEVTGDRPRYVSRGGLKLEAALEQFAIKVTGIRAIDAGSSTGGFTDALLQAGASSVVAIDVGTHQLHERLRADPRVELLEQTDIRAIMPERIGGKAAVVVADLSFISLRQVLESLLGLVELGGDVIVLLKPQFEAG
ncbi:MAG: TlyA family RNA methyltransferase, partial [Acidimicrobiales bacterium]